MNLTKTRLIDEFQTPPVAWKIQEAVEGEKSRVDGVNILARVVGPAFLIDGISRNNRMYKEETWDKGIAKVQERLESGGLLGTCGHDQEIDEKAILEGKVTHVVSKIWKEGKVGMCEFLVLGTDAGHNINKLLRAGVKLPVSSRAYGTYSGKGDMGEDIIDPDTFLLETWDWVLNPGVGAAVPNLVENKDQPKQDEPTPPETATPDAISEELTMTLERITEEKIALQGKVAEILEENKSLTASATSLTERVKELTTYGKSYQTRVGTLKEVKEITEHISKWLYIDFWKEVAKELNVFGQNNSTLAATTKSLMGVAEAYVPLGTPKKIQEEAKLLAQYKEYGTIQECQAASKLLEAYIKVGKPKEIIEKLNRIAAKEQADATARRADEALKISKKFGQPVAFVEKLLTKFSAKEVIDQFKSATSPKTAAMTERYKVPATAVKPGTKVVVAPAAQAGSGIAGRVFEKLSENMEKTQAAHARAMAEDASRRA